MKVLNGPEGQMTLQLDKVEAEQLRNCTRIAIAGLVTLYARARMKDAADFFVQLEKTLEAASTEEATP